MAIEDQEGGGRRTRQILILILLIGAMGCSGGASLEPSGNSLILAFRAPPGSAVLVLGGEADGPGYPRSNGRPFLSMSWPLAAGKTEILARFRTPSHGGVTLALPWPKERPTPRLVQAVAFVDESEGAPAVSVSPAFWVTRSHGELQVARDIWPGVHAAAPAFIALLLLGFACLAVRHFGWLERIPWRVRLIVVVASTGLCLLPRLLADEADSQGRRGDVHPIIPSTTSTIPPTESDTMLPLVEIILQQVPRYGSVRIAPCAASGAAYRAAGNAAWRLWPRHIIWMDETQSLEALRQTGCSLVFRPPPPELPEGVLLLGATKSAFVIEALPR